MAFDPEMPRPTTAARARGGHQGPAQHRPTGQIRYRVAEQNLYAYLFGVKKPIVHVMGYFVSVLRERIANFEAPAAAPAADARAPAADAATVHRHLDQRPAQEPARPERAHGPGVPLVRGALRHGARRLADHRHRPAAGGGVGAGGHQHRAQPGLVATSAWRRPRADQKIVQSRRAVEIETLQGPGRGRAARSRWPTQLRELKQQRPGRARAPTCATCGWRCSTRPQQVFVEVAT